jgi:hypothetical protein
MGKIEFTFNREHNRLQNLRHLEKSRQPRNRAKHSLVMMTVFRTLKVCFPFRNKFLSQNDQSQRTD